MIDRRLRERFWKSAIRYAHAEVKHQYAIYPYLGVIVVRDAAYAPCLSRGFCIVGVDWIKQHVPWFYTRITLMKLRGDGAEYQRGVVALGLWDVYWSI